MSNADPLLDTDINSKHKSQIRPVFVTVLCILTFIGVGMHLIWHIYKLIMLKYTFPLLNMTDELADKKSGTASSSEFQYLIDYARNAYIIITADFLGNILVLTGAIFMWRLNAKGFIFYCTGQLIPIILIYSLMGFNSTFGFSSVIVDGISITFIILYGTQVRNMKKQVDIENNW